MWSDVLEMDEAICASPGAVSSGFLRTQKDSRQNLPSVFVSVFFSFKKKKNVKVLK